MNTSAVAARRRSPIRRSSALLVAVVTVVMVLAGCASPAPTPEAPAAGATGTGLLPAGEGRTSYPLTLTTWAGESVIEQRPQRIAAIGFSTNMDVLEVLGVTPVYALTEETAWEWRDPAWVAGIETIDTTTRRDPINVESLAAARPDLIVALNSLADDGSFARLSAIAPVVEYGEQLGDQADWREGQRLVGQALDLSGAAETAITEAESSIAAVAAAHPEYAGRTVTIATEYSTGIEYYTVSGGTAETFMTGLGFAPNPLAENFVENPDVSNELVSMLDADVVIMSYLNDEIRQAREADGLFRRLPAVAENRYVAVVSEEPGSASNVTWVLRRGASASSLPWAAEAIADTWLADVDLAG